MKGELLSCAQRCAGRSAVRWAGVVPRRAKLEAPAPRDPGPLPSVRPVCAATRGLTRRRPLRFPMLFTRPSGSAR